MTTCTTVAAEADVASDRRRARFEARHTLWDETSLPRVRNCGRSVASNAAGVTVKVSTGDAGRSVGLGGLQTCGSVWSCPVCSAKIAAHRQGEIQSALSAWIGKGGKVALGTFTMRHRKGQALKSLWDGVASAWHAVASGSGWGEDQLAFGSLSMRDTSKGSCLVGRIPMIRVVEVTYGDAGWHVHIHTLMLLPGTSTAREVASLEDRMWSRWSAALARKGFDAIRSRGADLKLLVGDPSTALGEYFTKSVYRPDVARSASFEAARSDLKDAKGGNRSPFTVLADVVTHGDAEDLDVWHEWERGSKGRRQIAWSRGLRAELLDGEAELSDDEAAQLDAGGEPVAVISREVWALIVAARADFGVIAAFRGSDVAGRAFLDRWRL